MDFITIDFETADSSRCNPCEVGLTFVKDSQITETKSWLIKPSCYPYFDSVNIAIHGIKPNDVKKSPEFFELWNNEFCSLVENKFLIAHFATFDFSVLRATLNLYEIPFPYCTYGCTYVFAREAFPGLPMYGLESLCATFNISLENHHRAGADSRATAELALKIFSQTDIKSQDEIKEKLKVNLGYLNLDTYKPCGKIRIPTPAKPRTKLSAKTIVGDPDKQDPDNTFFEKTVAITGTLSSMERKKAFQIIADIGGYPVDGVTKDLDFLIVGQQDFRIVGQDGMSGKQEKALKYSSQGSLITVLSENEFLSSFDNIPIKQNSPTSTSPKQVKERGYSIIVSAPTHADLIKKIKEDCNNNFEGKVFVFTDLFSTSRPDAINMVIKAGGLVQNDVTQKTNFLVVGKQEEDIVCPQRKKAIEYLKQGILIFVLSEADFLLLLNNR